MKNLLIIVIIYSLGKLFAQEVSGEWILRKIDQNLGSENKISLAEMHISGQRGSRTIVLKSWIQGREQSFTEYLEPPREKGTKMLKITDQLWTYTPSTDRTIRISGHMLRQSVMGSDLSYEDLMEDTRLTDLYNATIISETQIDDRQCWELQLTAKFSDVAYATRKIWVDQERFVVLKEERFAKSGKLLKTTDVKKVEYIGKRWVATEINFKDVLKSGEGTTFIIRSIEFNAEIPDYIFSKASLRK